MLYALHKATEVLIMHIHWCCSTHPDQSDTSSRRHTGRHHHARRLRAWQHHSRPTWRHVWPRTSQLSTASPVGLGARTSTPSSCAAICRSRRATWSHPSQCLRLPAAAVAARRRHVRRLRHCAARHRWSPEHVVHTHLRPLSPWFDSDYRAARRHCRRLECRYHRSHSDTDRRSWVAAARSKLTLFQTKKNAAYWLARVQEDSQSNRLWRSLSGVIGHEPPALCRLARMTNAKLSNEGQTGFGALLRLE